MFQGAKSGESLEIATLCVAASSAGSVAKRVVSLMVLKATRRTVANAKSAH